MDRIVFAAQFAAAAEAAMRMARRYVIEDLPPDLRFRVRLNRSYDGFPAGDGGRRFPGDRDDDLLRCDQPAAIAALWRDGWTPEWVDLAVLSVTATTTLLEVSCAGRFHRTGSRFQGKSPSLPPHESREPFSLYLRAECRDAEDLAQLALAADRVWSLDLFTGHLDELPDLPNMEILEVAGAGWGDFTRFPRLRLLRLCGTTVPGPFRLPARLSELSLHLSEADFAFLQVKKPGN